MTPASMCTLSFSTSLRALVSAAAGWPSLSSRMTSSFRPPACQPVSCQYSSQPLYMSFPAAAMPPDRGAMKPILIATWAAVPPGPGATHLLVTAYQSCTKAFKVPTPYVVAMGEPAEGPRMLPNLINVEAGPRKLTCDMPVEVVFSKLTDEVTLPLFQPAGR